MRLPIRRLQFGAVEQEVVVGPVEVGFALRFEVADGVVRGGEDERLDARVDRGVVEQFRAVDVVLEHRVPRGVAAGIAGEVDHRADALAGLGDEGLVGDVADEVRVLGIERRRVVKQVPPLVLVGEPLADGRPDRSLGPGEQHGLVH